MTELLSISIVNALLTIFVMVLWSKWGIMDFWDTYKPKLFKGRCYFCYGFWINLLICTIQLATGVADIDVMNLFTAPAIVYILYNEK
jgi:hypothetical protein